MSDVSIPFALDPRGVEVPIEEAIRGRVDYYFCPECGNPVTPRKGEKRVHYYAHKQGVLDDGECELSSRADVDRMVDDLRRSDIERKEEARQIRIYLGEKPGGRHRLFGVIPSANWEQFPMGAEVDSLVEGCSVSTEGIVHPPTARSFHPSEAEATFELDPSANEYRVTIDGPEELDNLVGEWSAGGVKEGDLFVGDQTRARRIGSKRQIKTGEWVYAVTDGDVAAQSDEMSSHRIGDLDILAFPAREGTTELLGEFGKDLRTDEYGFDADVILPADAHPTADKPIEAPPGELVLIGVTPKEDIDPVFEVVSIPKREGETVELEQTGPGNTRFFKTKVPERGSRRVSVHQRNSSRHRPVHLHAVEPVDQAPLADTMYDSLGVSINMDGEKTLLSPLGDRKSIEIGETVSPVTLPGIIEYTGPEGLELEIEAEFPPEADLDTVYRTTTDLQSELANVGHWVTQGCTGLDITFEGIGTVSLSFSNQTEEETK